MINGGNKVIMFLKIQFLEGKSRRKLYQEQNPKYVYVASGRINCAKNGNFDMYKSLAVAYAWYIWEKGYKGDTIVRWFN